METAEQIKKYINLTVGKNITELKDVESLKILEAEWISKILALNETQDVLDYGAGFGFITNAIANKVNFVHTYDVDQNWITLCENNCIKHSNIKHHGPSIESLHDIKVNTILLKDVVENFTFDHFVKTFDMFDTIAKPNCKIFFNFYNQEFYNKDNNDKSHFTIEQIQQIANNINYKIVLLEKNKLYSFVLLKKQ